MSNQDRNQSGKFESLDSATEALQELLRQGSVEESKIEGQPVRLFAEALETCKVDLNATRRCEILQRYARNNGEEELPPELMVRTCGGRLEQEQACLVPILCNRQIKDFERFQEIVASKNLRGDNPKVEGNENNMRPTPFWTQSLPPIHLILSSSFKSCSKKTCWQHCWVYHSMGS
jgi:hypothetical protein